MNETDRVRTTLKEEAVGMVRLIAEGRAWSSARIAKAIGVAPSTITRILDPESKFSPSAKTLDGLVRLVVDLRLADIEASDTRASHVRKLTGARIETLFISGEVRSGAWVEGGKLSGPGSRPSPIFSREWIGRDIAVWELADASTWVGVPAGSLLIVDGDLPGEDGDVLLLRRQLDGPEATVFEHALWRLYDDGRDLRLESCSGTQAAPLVHGALQESSKVLGVVAGLYQPKAAFMRSRQANASS